MSAGRAIAANTFTEAMREKVLYVLGGFAVLLFAGSRLAAPLALGEGRRIICDLGVFALSAFGLLVIIFVGHSLVHREIERGSVIFIFSRPVGRGSFVVGKYLGLAFVLGVIEAVMGIVLAVVLALSRYHVGSALPGAVILTLMQLWILSAVAILFASVGSPVTAGLFVLGVWIIGNTAGVLAQLPGLRPILWIVPRLDLYNPGNWLIHGDVPSAERWAFLISYAALYICAALFFARAAFARRQLLGQR
jgi:ABC-type transport system involved in multi-copper enzyme maturation permease subunit